MVVCFWNRATFLSDIYCDLILEINMVVIVQTMASREAEAEVRKLIKKFHKVLHIIFVHDVVDKSVICDVVW